ncbi:PRTRC system protein D [Paraburkholderia domus]|uniref:PRTRC system protein D n=1 Tax=Paraburkholderia domus TaxID=2793075 RepID=UPI001912B5E0|nr:PRTRC system protein D [Paraburkholderia domus]MBK5064824.1 PRTRC system protein D [Burkholderia sp. R-70199]CAE6956860.1 hypothetical protein R70199_07021 [Paraburkholderia domus]
MKTNVLAVDVGYGNTKFAYRAADGTVATGMFPSLAQYAPARSISGGNGTGFRTRDVTQVTINGTPYEVGPGVSMTAAYGNTGRVLVDDYVLSNNYAALLAGAIYRSGHTRIARLVLGLPVHTLAKFSRDLVERFVGDHDFGQGVITIEKVNVIAQPLGTLTYATTLRADKSGASQQHLVVDVGYYTTDWVYVSDFQIDDRRSGGRPGGMSQILQRIAEDIGKDQGEPVYDIERIDVCLREGRPFHFYNQEIDIQSYLTDAQQVINDVMVDVKNRVGPVEGIRSIILSGGGADLYGPIIRQTFPRTFIDKLENPCFANASGFLIVGESASRTVH